MINPALPLYANYTDDLVRVTNLRIHEINNKLNVPGLREPEKLALEHERNELTSALSTMKSKVILSLRVHALAQVAGASSAMVSAFHAVVVHNGRLLPAHAVASEGSGLVFHSLTYRPVAKPDDE